MIRIIHEWRVEPEDIAAFREAWKQTTTAIAASPSAPEVPPPA